MKRAVQTGYNEAVCVTMTITADETVVSFGVLNSQQQQQQQQQPDHSLSSAINVRHRRRLCVAAASLSVRPFSLSVTTN